MANKIPYKRPTLANTSGMPQMNTTLDGWVDEYTMTKTKTTTVDGDATVVETSIRFSGVIQPLSARDLELKPDGERAWQWLQVHSYSGSLNLNNGDLVKNLPIPFNNQTYKVKQIIDYSRNGYIEYHLCKHFEARL